MSANIQSPILWQNDECTVTVLDIPRSIAHAQGTAENPHHALLQSTEPLQNPYPTNEPKSAAAKAKFLKNNTVKDELQEQHEHLISRSLEGAKSNFSKPWCLPRPCTAERPRITKKRGLDPELEYTDIGAEGLATAAESIDQNDLPSDLLPSLAAKGLIRYYGMEIEDFHGACGDQEQTLESCESIATRSMLSLPNPNNSASVSNFSIPSGSSFILGNCTIARVLHNAVRSQAQKLDTNRKFDFILLDPPWPNRSVKRTHKTANSTYSTLSTLWATQELIAGMDLDSLMADDCLVGIWITNKIAVRELVLGEGGIFDCWGVELVEEWLWLKTTILGDPVTPLNSVCRKPYEVLLLGRKSGRHYAPAREEMTRHTIMQRVLMSVPDLHSRKPCLKELITPLIPSATNYRALEVFARHLVAGWWSWGNECIKFNWEGYWKEADIISKDA